MPVKDGRWPACAVCKYQRRKCSKDCELAQYFPADKPENFASVHKLFGVSNILKILNKISDPVERSVAMRTMIYEADSWKRNPHLGCAFEIRLLQYEIFILSQEYEGVMREIASFQQQQGITSSSSLSSMSSHLQISTQQPTDNLNNISPDEPPSSFVVDVDSSNIDVDSSSAYHQQPQQRQISTFSYTNIADDVSANSEVVIEGPKTIQQTHEEESSHSPESAANREGWQSNRGTTQKTVEDSSNKASADN